MTILTLHNPTRRDFRPSPVASSEDSTGPQLGCIHSDTRDTRTHGTSKVTDVAFDDYAAALKAALATELYDLRAARGVSYDVLAEESGINRRTLIRMLQGEAAIDVGALYRICRVLVQDPRQVLGAAERRVQRETEGQ